MKKFLLLLFIIPLFARSQDCKYDLNTYDNFLKISKKEKEVKVHKASGMGDGYLKLTFCKYDSSVFFRVMLIKENDGVVVGKSDALIFLLEDGATIKSFPDQIYSSNARLSTNQEVLNATYHFDSPGLAMELLKHKKVKSIRIYYNDVFHDYDIKDKFSESLLKTANCF